MYACFSVEIFAIFIPYNTAYRKKSFSSKESDTKMLQSKYFAYEVGAISSYPNRSSPLQRSSLLQ